MTSNITCYYHADYIIIIIILFEPYLSRNGAYKRRHTRGVPLNTTGVNGSAVTMGTEKGQ